MYELKHAAVAQWRPAGSFTWLRSEGPSGDSRQQQLAPTMLAIWERWYKWRIRMASFGCSSFSELFLCYLPWWYALLFSLTCNHTLCVHPLYSKIALCGGRAEPKSHTVAHSPRGDSWCSYWCSRKHEKRHALKKNQFSSPMGVACETVYRCSSNLSVRPEVWV